MTILARTLLRVALHGIWFFSILKETGKSRIYIVLTGVGVAANS